VAAVDEAYLTAVQNRNTGQWNGTVFQVFNHLMMRYGRISSGQLAQFERETDDLMVDMTLPIEVVFNKIEDLLDYGEIAQAPYTQLEAVNKGYNIINKTGMYNEYIKTWLRRPLNQRTWMNFKTHFQETYDELQETGQLQFEFG